MPQKNILVAALDWGLGHATRLIPVIDLLKAKECKVILAASGSALDYWQLIFPNEKIIDLPAYNPVYRGNMNVSMILQTPKFLKAIYAENEALKKIVTQYHIHGIISDNRYGFYHAEVPSVIITHQLFIQTSELFWFLKPLLKKLNFHFLKQFHFCWIPDVQNNNNLSGALSHGEDIPNHCRYIGLLSRFQYKEKLTAKNNVLLLLSGPEPQRNILEKKLLLQLKNLNEQITLVRGTNKPFKHQELLSEKTKVIDIASTEILQELLNESTVVVARSGYSTVMDLVATRRPAVLIPTPGQTEQEYLAYYLQQKQWFVSATQNNFNLEKLIPQALNTTPVVVEPQSDLLNNAVDEFLATI
jgi:spore coat polysaccharide biosynthesis predicted glycosyltransferase SpsG